MKIKGRELLNIGFPEGPIIGEAIEAVKTVGGFMQAEAVREILRGLCKAPENYINHPNFGQLAISLRNFRNPPKAEYEFSDDKPLHIYGQDQIDEPTIEQVKNALALPVSAAAALMPDGHLGYGLPIGGVLATRNAVIPYAVGVDIACRMMLSILPDPVDDKRKHPCIRHRDEFVSVIEENTRFGMGAQFEDAKLRDHPVMDDEDWNAAEITKNIKEKARKQLGTSGSGNHFVDMGEIEFTDALVIHGHVVVPAGRYLAILSHSGSRGPGAQVAAHYSKLAQTYHPDLPKQYKHLAWLDMDGDGAEYWTAMELMGRYASANHHCIHAGLLKSLKVKPLFQVENHHNFAWKELIGGPFGTDEFIIHRKGATPAGPGVLGIIPGTMASPAYLVEGTVGPADVKVASLHSASHGAGRAHSRKKTKELNRWSHVKAILKERGVDLISAGLDECPGGYKNIDSVMDAQRELVNVKAVFNPRLVKMSDDGTSED
jgi:tRNA-splicing ligase RtcB